MKIGEESGWGMKPDKVFVLMLVILLPLTGCIDVSDNAGAEDSTDSGDDGVTVVNNYYNNTTTVVQQQEPDLVHEYLSWDEVANWSLTLEENQVLEWVSLYAYYLIDYTDGRQFTNYGMNYNVWCYSNETVVDLGDTVRMGDFAFKGEGDCTYRMMERIGSTQNVLDLHVHLMYRIHDVELG